MKLKVSIATMALGLTLTSSLQAVNLVTTDFGALTAATDAELNANTTGTVGGTWSLGTGGTIVQALSGTAGALPALNQALHTEDTTTGTGVPTTYVTLSTASAISLAGTDDVTWTFDIGTRRTGTSKGYQYEFLEGTTVAVTVLWLDNGGSSAGGDVALNAGAVQNSPFAGFNPWDDSNAAEQERKRRVTITFDKNGTDIGMSFDGSPFGGPAALDFTGTVLGGATEIDGFRVVAIGPGAARGGYLGALSVDAIPEPSSALLGLLGAFGLFGIRRRCR